MKDFSVDKKGLSFSLSVLIASVLLVLLYSAWLPVHRSVMSALKETEDTQTVASAAEAVPAFETYAQTDPHTTLVHVNFETEQVELIDEDQTIALFEIESIPSLDSPDSVPAGTYVVDKKEAVKLSTITMVRFPYYVTFGDRYALHAPPTGANGETLTEDFSGSKITLREADAKLIYGFVNEGMPVVVTPSSDNSSEREVKERTAFTYDELPATSAASYVVGDIETGEIYLAKASDDRYPIASITKLITAAVATDVIGHGEFVVAPDGKRYTLSDLYYPLLLRSDNAVAERIAIHAGRSFFLNNMNAYTHALGMTESTFADPSGLSPRNISTANDLFTFATHLFTEKYFLFDITHEESMTITSTGGDVWSVTNQNKLASDPHFQGGKLGYTDEAEQTSLAVFSVPLGEQTRSIAVIVLQSSDWKQDTRTLLRWLVEQSK